MQYEEDMGNFIVKINKAYVNDFKKVYTSITQIELSTQQLIIIKSRKLANEIAKEINGNMIEI